MAEIRGLVGTGRRESFTFTPSAADELIRIYKIDGCIGDTELKRIQIEEGRRATDFVTPQYVETQIRGLFKDLRDIRLEITDEDSDTWSKIRANSKAALVEYHEGNLMSSLGISPQQHIQAFEDKISGDYATFEQRLNGMQTNIRNGADEYTNTQLAKLRQTEIKNLDGRISTATQTLDVHATRLQGVEGSVSSHTQTLQGFQNKLEDAEGNISTNTQLINGFDRQVEEMGERFTRVSETIDGIRTTVRDEAYSYTDTELAKLRRTEIKNIQGSVSEMEQSIENFRRTLQTASGDFSQVEQTLQGIREEFEAGDREVKASFERTLNGMETQIKKDNKSYTDTAIADLKQTEIESLDGRVTTATQTVDGFSRRIRDAEGAISSVRQSVQGFDQRIQGVEGSYSQLSQTVGGLTTAVSGHNGLQSRVTQLADQLSSKVSSDDFSTHLSQYSDTIWAAVRSRVPSSSGKMTGSEIISAIRLDRSGVKISGSKVQITGETSIDNAVIKSGHIHSLNADKITTGTLNAARVRVINLDANNITSGKLKAIDIEGGRIKALNDNMEINLRTGVYEVKTDKAAFRRTSSTYGNMFMKMMRGYSHDLKQNVGLFAVGSNRWNSTSESTNDGGFAGIRIWNGNKNGDDSNGFLDAVDVVGDRVYIMHKASTEGPDTYRGWVMDTYNDNKHGGLVNMKPFGAYQRAEIHVTDLFIKTSTGERSLKSILGIR